MKQLMELPVLRTTGLREFAACPAKWRNDFLVREMSTDTRETKIGTAAHTLIEIAMCNYYNPEGYAQIDIRETIEPMSLIPDAEIDNLYAYIEKCLNLPIHKLIATEHEFRIAVDGIDLPIKGTIDVVYQREDGTIIIMDHKTNRNLEPKVYWMKNLQMRIYAWAARQIWPGHPIEFQLGYVNFNLFYEWPTFAEDDEVLLNELRRMWIDMKAYEESSVWPRKPNANCRWCALHDNCDVRKNALVEFKQSLTDMFNPPPLAVALERVNLICKLAEEEKRRLEEQIYAMCADSEEPIVLDGYSYRIKQSQTRTIDAIDALPTLVEYVIGANTSEEMLQRYGVLANLVNVKVTTVDKLKKLGEVKLHSALASVMSEKPGARRIEVRPVDKLQASIVEGIES